MPRKRDIDYKPLFELLKPYIREEYDELLKGTIDTTKRHTLLPLIIARNTSGFEEFYEKLTRIYEIAARRYGVQVRDYSKHLRNLDIRFHGTPCSCGYLKTIRYNTIVSGSGTTFDYNLCPLALLAHYTVAVSKGKIIVLPADEDIDIKNSEIVEVGKVKVVITDENTEHQDIMAQNNAVKARYTDYRAKH